MAERAALEPVWARRGFAAFALAALCLLSLLPLLRLAGAALLRGGYLRASAPLAEVLSPQAITAFEHSLLTGCVSALLALVIGASAAVTVGMVNLKGRRVFAFLFVLSMLMAPQVVALAFLAASGPSSPLLQVLGLAPAPGTPNPLHSAGGISLVLGLHHAPHGTASAAA
jgi:iron(III) transport system permease protein